MTHMLSRRLEAFFQYQTCQNRPWWITGKLITISNSWIASLFQLSTLCYTQLSQILMMVSHSLHGRITFLDGNSGKTSKTYAGSSECMKFFTKLKFSHSTIAWPGWTSTSCLIRDSGAYLSSVLKRRSFGRVLSLDE